MTKPKQTKQTIRIIGPQEWTFDKIVAAFLILLKLRLTFRSKNVELLFVPEQHQDVELWQEWMADPNTYVIDLGRNKYQFQAKGSSTQMVVERLLDQAPQGVLAELVEMTIKNNQTGYLKKQYQESVVGQLRELYKLGEEAGYSQRNVVIAVGDLVHEWLQVRSEIDLKRSQESLLAEPELEDLLKVTGTKFEDFTLSQYILHLWVRGHSVKEIQKRLAYFYDGKKVVAGERAKAKAEFEAMPEEDKKVFAQGKGLWIRSDSRFVTGYAMFNAKNRKGKLYDLIMVRRITQGNVVFMARSTGKNSRTDLGFLATLMILLEGHAQFDQERGQWFFDERLNALFNGTDIHVVDATSVKDQTFALLVEILVYDRQDFDGPRLMRDLKKAVGEDRHDDLQWQAIKEVLTGEFPEELYKLVLAGQDWRLGYLALRDRQRRR